MPVQTENQQTTPPVPDDSAERLMRILESVRLERAEPAEQSEEAPGGQVCPQCNSIEPWGNSSWCPECGYYPKLGRAITPVEMDASQGHPALSFTWLPPLLIGIATLVAGSIALRYSYPELAARAFYGRFQLVIGVSLFILGHVQAYILGARNSGELSISALFLEPVQIWMNVLRKLPESQQILWWGSWGITTMVLALTVVGVDVDGMVSSVAPKKKKPKSLMGTMVKAMAAAEGKSAFSNFKDEGDPEESAEEAFAGAAIGGRAPTTGNIEDAMKDFAGMAGVQELAATGREIDLAAQKSGALKNLDDAESKLDPKEEILKDVPVSPTGQKRTELGEFIIFGYLTNSTGELRSILLAEAQEDRVRFVSKLSLEETSPEKCAALQMILKEIRVSRPPLSVPYNAHWVRPLIRCQVAFVDWSNTGKLEEGYLVSFDSTKAKELLKKRMEKLMEKEQIEAQRETVR